MSDVLKYHQWCISDPVLMPAYSLAIKKIVRPGDVVFDLGAGTGILGMMACAAGASKVYAVDPSEIIALVPEIAAANGFAERIIVQQKLSYDFEPGERADVVIASMQGTAGIGNDLLTAVIDARERLLKPGGMIIPLAIEPAFSPVEFTEWYASRIDSWNEPRSGLTFEPVRAYAVNRLESFRVNRAALLAAPESLPGISFAEATKDNLTAQLTFYSERDGLMHALAGWVKVTVAEGISCSSSPLEDKRMLWDHMALPVELPLTVRRGERIDVKIRVNMVKKQPVAQWDVSVSGVELHQSGFRGMLISKSDLK